MPNPSPLKGWKTLIWNAVIVAGGALATWAVGIDWTQYLSPTMAMVAAAVVNVMLRVLTTGPVGSKE